MAATETAMQCSVVRKSFSRKNYLYSADRTGARERWRPWSGVPGVRASCIPFERVRDAYSVLGAPYICSVKMRVIARIGYAYLIKIVI